MPRLRNPFVPPPPLAQPPIAYGVADAARIAGLGRSLVDDAIKRGELRSLKIRARRLVLHKDLVAWLEGQAA